MRNGERFNLLNSSTEMNAFILAENSIKSVSTPILPPAHFNLQNVETTKIIERKTRGQ